MTAPCALEGAATRAPHHLTSGSHGGRIPELDALRGLAALGVLAFHTMDRYFFWAWSCVDLFFILSAFLITGILLANRNSPRMLLSFYARRALRIWPVYYVTFLAVVVLWVAGGWLQGRAWTPLPSGHWLGLVFLQYVDRYSSALPPLDYIRYFSHSWSLAVEEQFYLAWPLLFFALKPRLAWLLPACAMAVLGAALARAEGYYSLLLITRVDGLMFGIVLAFLVRDRKRAFYRASPMWLPILTAAGLVLLGPYLLSHGTEDLLAVGPRCVAELTGFCLVYAAIIGVAIRWTGARWLAPLRLRPLVHAGKLSFAIYMYQAPIAHVLFSAVAAHRLSITAAHVLIWILAIVAAQLSFWLIERRTLALKSRFPYEAQPPRGEEPAPIPVTQ